jgi:hypothetical protein
LRELGNLMIEVGGMDEGFGGDAALIEADPAEPVLLDEGHISSELSGPDGRDIPSRPAADDRGARPSLQLPS